MLLNFVDFHSFIVHFLSNFDKFPNFSATFIIAWFIMILTIHGEIVINIYGKKQTVTSLKVTLIELNFASSKIQVKQREASKAESKHETR